MTNSVAAIAVDRLVKVYKGGTAVDGISFSLPQGSITGLLGGNGAGKTTTIAMIMGLVMPTSGPGVRARRRHAAAALSRAAPDEFRKPLCRHADAADGAAEPAVFGKLYGVDGCRGPHRELAEELDLNEFLDRPTGKLSAGQKTRVSLGKVAAQQAGSPAARRADRLARSRHRRLGARRILRRYRARARRDDPARLPQHDRGRAAVRARHHDEARRDRGRRHAAAPARALRPRNSGGGVPRHRARPRRGAGRPRNERTDRSLILRVLVRAASARWCCAIGICCARPGRGCSS